MANGITVEFVELLVVILWNLASFDPLVCELLMFQKLFLTAVIPLCIPFRYKYQC